MVIAIGLLQTQGTRLVDPPRPLQAVRVGETDVVTLMMGKIEVVPAQGSIDPTGSLDEGGPVYVATQTSV